MRRNTNVMYDVCNITFQIPVTDHRMFQRRCCSCFRIFRMDISDIPDSVNQHIIIKRLHDIIWSAHIKCIFCHTVPSDSTDNNKCRRLSYLLILMHFFHHCQSVNLRHYNIQQNNIRFFLLNDVKCIFSIRRRTDYGQILFLSDDLPKYL